MDGKAVSLTRAGDSADVTLAGIDATAVGSGSVLCHPDFPVQLVTRWASVCACVGGDGGRPGSADAGPRCLLSRGRQPR